MNKLNIFIGTSVFQRGIRTVWKGTFNYNKHHVQICNQTITAVIHSLFIPWHSCFPCARRHQGTPWEFCMFITDACVFHRKLNDATKLRKRALDPHLNKPQHCLATEIKTVGWSCVLKGSGCYLSFLIHMQLLKWSFILQVSKIWLTLFYNYFLRTFTNKRRKIVLLKFYYSRF